MKNRIVLLFLCLSSLVFAQENEYIPEEIFVNKFVTGTLLRPDTTEKVPLVIFIQGSGPTDRNGNQPGMQNNSLKMLAEALAENNIASFRYDKRISKMQELEIQEGDLRFEDFVADAVSAVNYFKKNDNYTKIIILGHSQGSLVGMLAAKDNVDAFISVAGAAQPIDSIITEQITQQMPALQESVRNTFKEIRQNGSTTNYNPLLASVFRPSVQPFLLSYLKYNPVVEIAKLHIPVLIINGTRDLQISAEEAKQLKKANPAAKLVLLEHMNHVLKKIEDPTANFAAYNKPEKPLHPELVPVITSFINNI